MNVNPVHPWPCKQSWDHKIQIYRACVSGPLANCVAWAAIFWKVGCPCWYSAPSFTFNVHVTILTQTGYVLHYRWWVKQRRKRERRCWRGWVQLQHLLNVVTFVPILVPMPLEEERERAWYIHVHVVYMHVPFALASHFPKIPQIYTHTKCVYSIVKTRAVQDCGLTSVTCYSVQT